MRINELIESGNVAAMRDAIQSREISVAALTGAYLDRINARDGVTNAVLALNPGAMAEAARKDEWLAATPAGTLPALFGIPVLVKDNIETMELPTTAGSLALADNWTRRDATIIAALRENGAIILGKTNLSEWANFRSRRSSSGWSAVGGQTSNAHDVTRSPCGSSSGSAVAVAARLAPLAIGTETNGSVVCPAHVNGVVGIKPTVGVLAQDGIVPISHSQDTAGPMALDVESAALLMTAMQSTSDFGGTLAGASLAGKRIGVVRSATGYHDDVDTLFNDAIGRMRDAGAIMVDDLTLLAGYDGFRRDTFLVLLYEFKHDLNAYFRGLPNGLSSLTLDQLIAFNEAHAVEEMAIFPQDIFLRAEATDDTESYEAALSRVQQATRSGIDDLLEAHSLDALVAPTGGPAWKIDHVNGDHSLGSFASFPAVSGYPHITLPMGKIQGLPVGLSLTAGHGSDATIIALAYALEKR